MKADYFKAMRLALQAAGEDPILKGASYDEVRKHGQKVGEEYVRKLREYPTSLQRIKAVEKSWLSM
jgi:hypothetical protein